MGLGEDHRCSSTEAVNVCSVWEKRAKPPLWAAMPRTLWVPMLSLIHILTDAMKKMYFVEDMDLSPLACAYARARGADRMSSFGDWIALSDTCDESTARVIQHEVTDGIIAPGYTDAALAILKSKRKGGYNVVQIDPAYTPAPVETKDVFGITFEQGRNEAKFDGHTFDNIVTRNKTLTDEQKRDLILCLITLKYTQSNSVCYAEGGQVIGVGAGQQSRIHCTRLAGNKADIWHLRQHPKALSLPFRDDVSRPNRDNAIDVYISEEYEDVIGEDVWADTFTVRPEPLTAVSYTHLDVYKRQPPTTPPRRCAGCWAWTAWASSAWRA